MKIAPGMEIAKSVRLIIINEVKKQVAENKRW